MIIDAHVHVWDRGYHPLAYEEFMARRISRATGRSYDELLPRIMGSVADPEGKLMVGDMEAAGVDAVVIMVLDFAIAMEDELPIPIEEINRRFCELEALHPQRMFSFFGVDPRRPNAAELFAAALASDHPPVGLKIYASTGFYPYEECCQPLYRIAAERELPVLFETGVVGAPMRPRFARPSFLIDVVAAFPTMPVIVGHVGRSAWWEEALAAARGCPSMRLDLSGWWQERRKLGEETLLRDLARLRDELGAHRLQWGTDRSSGPGRSGERSTWPAEVAWWKDLRQTAAAFDLEFTDEEVELIIGENAAGLLRAQGRLPAAART